MPVIQLACMCALIFCRSMLTAQERGTVADLSTLSWSTDSTGPRRFVSVHGRRAAIFGYSQEVAGDNGGLEVWAYPVQILSSYGVAFRHEEETTAIDGETILRRIVYSPEAVTRIYVGPDFIVREKLFVPADEPGGTITYEVEGSRAVDIEIRFTPVLDLMWPAAIGGQETLWNAAASAYLLSDLTHRFRASIGSADIVAHDDTLNISKHVGRAPGLAFTLRAGAQHKVARVIIAEGGTRAEVDALSKKLSADSASFEKKAADRYLEMLNHALQIDTSDADINRALAWSEIALDQAWVCNPDLGCGIVAGYGPSRKARRPQYDWFFAGDGMVAIQGLLAAGEYTRARQELEFILKYQDQKSGMIWHEMSQSAGILDWAKYPYMFVHVDLTFQFLGAIGDYFLVTGDLEFVRAHWSSIQAAYDYCRTTLDAQDGLPRIPADKEGGREQDALSDEMMLSASWASSAQAFAQLATVTGHSAEAAQAVVAHETAHKAIKRRYWNERDHAWITGFTRSGTPLIAHDIGAARIADKDLFSAEQRNLMLDEVASSDFQADWGTRGNSSKASSYNPNSYSSGSVWATGTSEIASAFWTGHRPATALPVWNALVPWSALDSPGHIHEAMAGDFYHEELESVPEQTWSSSSFLTSAVHGLLGLQIDGGQSRLTFAPHLPAAWNGVTLRHVHVGNSELTLKLVQSIDEIKLEITNQGAPVRILFGPEIPFGARLKTSWLGGKEVKADLEENSEDTHARIEFDAAHGNTDLSLSYSGGVAIIPDAPAFAVGDSSKAIKITGVKRKGNVYTVSFAYRLSVMNGFDLRTAWPVKEVKGATIDTISSNLYRVKVIAPDRGEKNEQESEAYRQGETALTFVTDQSK
jgi:glycogen debranching enzyme